MTRTTDLLLRVAEFLKKLTDDQIDAIAAGDARLDVVPKGARIVSATPKTAAPLTVSVERIDADLKALGTRDAAGQYLRDLKLSKAHTVDLAKALGVVVASKDTITTLISHIVEQKVGYRADTDAILGRR